MPWSYTASGWSVVRIKAQVAWLEGIAPEDQVVLVADGPLEDEAVPSWGPWFPGLGWERKRSDSQGGQTGEKKSVQAKRRMQHSQRFVNVVPTFGEKKGPNANS
ncbi:ubiquitin-like FUBI-ribosomal protein eS30 fusion protein [Mesoplodon densirostris]|uniref:ubiquitin-like FUBI-ribosomal protein eS30 fusion protein n=1 Tax=Mesoplodon densirostris TaxID=48708 RepID=UPI0028DAF6A0|nr:ubiquitin-like FUBI-ribosomal protein eS30 fusion protein [Mesoplodon densirostris]